VADVDAERPATAIGGVEAIPLGEPVVQFTEARTIRRTRRSISTAKLGPGLGADGRGLRADALCCFSVSPSP